jgi:penicillin-binding protein 1B
VTRRRYWLFVPLIVVSCAAVYLVQLDHRVTSAFDSHRFEVPAQVYASPLELRPGIPLSVDDLAHELLRLQYQRVATIKQPGEFTSSADRLEVWLRSAQFADGAVPARRLTIAASAGVIQTLYEGNQQLRFERFEPLRIGSIYPPQGEDRIILAPGEVPPLLTAAIKAMEDRRFDRRWGVDVAAIGRALWVDARAGRAEEGASTITQQLVKGFFPSGGRTLHRKVPEALMAMLLELHYSKPDILNAYLNEVPLGQDGDRAVHGFGMAAQFYYGKPLSDIDVSQVAMLVALVRGPTLYDPRHNALAAIERRNLVLRSLVAQHIVSPDAARAAVAEPLEVLDRPGGAYFPDYLDLVHRTLKDEYREEDLTADGLKIFTSFDPRAQEAVERAVQSKILQVERKNRDAKSQLQVAAVVTAPATGDVIALVGDRRLGYAGYNRALDARRPIGSLVKPFIYLAALESGQYNATTIIDDAPVEVRIRGHRPWQPVNFTREAYGPVPLVRALAESLNLATVGLGLELGLPTVAHSIERFGLDHSPKPYPSLLLGSVSLSPLEVAQIYGGLANDGTVVRLRAVQAVLTRDGTPVKAYGPTPASVADPGAVYQVDRMMQIVMERGTGRSARTVLPSTLTVAGKSGTSSDLRDSWFAGFSGTHLTVVWVGYDDDRPSGLTGSSGALPIWAQIMANLRTTSWNRPMPPSLHDVPVDYSTGLTANPSCSTDLLSVPVPVEFTPAPKAGCVLANTSPPPPAQASPTPTATPQVPPPPAATDANLQNVRHLSLMQRVRNWFEGSAPPDRSTTR